MKVRKEIPMLRLRKRKAERVYTCIYKIAREGAYKIARKGEYKIARKSAYKIARKGAYKAVAFRKPRTQTSPDPNHFLNQIQISDSVTLSSIPMELSLVGARDKTSSMVRSNNLVAMSFRVSDWQCAHYAGAQQ